MGEYFFRSIVVLLFEIEIVKEQKKLEEILLKHAGIFVVIAQHSNLTYSRAIVQLILIFGSWNRTPHVDLYKLYVYRTLYKHTQYGSYYNRQTNLKDTLNRPNKYIRLNSLWFLRKPYAEFNRVKWIVAF